MLRGGEADQGILIDQAKSSQSAVSSSGTSTAVPPKFARPLQARTTGSTDDVLSQLPDSETGSKMDTAETRKGSAVGSCGWKTPPPSGAAGGESKSTTGAGGHHIQICARQSQSSTVQSCSKSPQSCSNRLDEQAERVLAELRSAGLVKDQLLKDPGIVKSAVAQCLGNCDSISFQNINQKFFHPSSFPPGAAVGGGNVDVGVGGGERERERESKQNAESKSAHGSKTSKATNNTSEGAYSIVHDLPIILPKNRSTSPGSPHRSGGPAQFRSRDGREGPLETVINRDGRVAAAQNNNTISQPPGVAAAGGGAQVMMPPGSPALSCSRSGSESERPGIDYKKFSPNLKPAKFGAAAAQSQSVGNNNNNSSSASSSGHNMMMQQGGCNQGNHFGNQGGGNQQLSLLNGGVGGVGGVNMVNINSINQQGGGGIMSQCVNNPASGSSSSSGENLTSGGKVRGGSPSLGRDNSSPGGSSPGGRSIRDAINGVGISVFSSSQVLKFSIVLR